MKRGIFVTGTDTGVGKSLVSAALIYGLGQQGLTVAGIKPVAAGCQMLDGRLVSEDVVLLQSASNVVLSPEIVNSYAFEPPLAPHIAAHMAGRVIELPPILDAVAQAQAQTDVVVVEGVGGFRVPLNETQDTADLAVCLGMPVVLVVGMRLGCQNHALLTAEAIEARGLKIAGWVANCIDPQMQALQANIAALQEKLSIPCLGVITYMRYADFRVAAGCVRFSELLKRVTP